MAYDLAVSANSNAPIISFYAAADAGEITHEQMYQTLDEMLYANLDVTLGGSSWNVVFLAANRTIQDELRAEIATAKGHEVAPVDNSNDAKVAEGQEKSNFSTYLQSSTTLLAACVLESARLRPLAAFSVPQSAPTSRLVDGYLVPAGTSFVIDSYALNIHNPFWGADAATYNPRRFI
ncbi:MAG: hypothetical protein LQ350_004703 [Teloschistes chrysophthalmus]|nr:MAG: hypothetical protein LQ350_004703 [Niorma chrysophthalma]